MKIRKLMVLMILLLVASVAQAGGDASRGAELTDDCAICHGDDGLGDEDFPAIAGQEEAELVKKLKDFKSGEIENLDMSDFVADLSEQDIADLAAYYASLTVGAAPRRD